MSHPPLRATRAWPTGRRPRRESRLHSSHATAARGRPGPHRVSAIPAPPSLPLSFFPSLSPPFSFSFLFSHFLLFPFFSLLPSSLSFLLCRAPGPRPPLAPCSPGRALHPGTPPLGPAPVAQHARPGRSPSSSRAPYSSSAHTDPRPGRPLLAVHTAPGPCPRERRARARPRDPALARAAATPPPPALPLRAPTRARPSRARAHATADRR